jgi:hypothetical protein
MTGRRLSLWNTFRYCNVVMSTIPRCIAEMTIRMIWFVGGMIFVFLWPKREPN